MIYDEKVEVYPPANLRFWVAFWILLAGVCVLVALAGPVESLSLDLVTAEFFFFAYFSLSA